MVSTRKVTTVWTAVNTVLEGLIKIEAVKQYHILK